MEFLKILASGDLDEFRIADLLASGAEIDGFGAGTRFTVSQHAPAIGIVYKIAHYDGRGLYKTSPEKATLPGRKTVIRVTGTTSEKDIVRPLDPDADDLLAPFESAESMATIQQRLEGNSPLFPMSSRRSVIQNRTWSNSPAFRASRIQASSFL